MTRAPRRARYSARAYWLPIVFFYVGSLAAPLILDPSYLRVASWALSFATGVAVVLATKWCNVWMLSMVGFSQFAVMMLPSLIASPELVAGVVRLREPVQSAALCTAGGLAGELLARRRWRAQVLSPTEFIRWVNPIGKPPEVPALDWIEFVQKLATHAATAWSIWQLIRW